MDSSQHHDPFNPDIEGDTMAAEDFRGDRWARSTVGATPDELTVLSERFNQLPDRDQWAEAQNIDSVSDADLMENLVVLRADADFIAAVEAAAAAREDEAQSAAAASKDSAPAAPAATESAPVAPSSTPAPSTAPAAAQGATPPA